MKHSKIGLFVSVIAVLAFCSIFLVACGGEAAQNKKIAIALFNELFVEKKIEAVDKYIGPTYIQHNPMFPDGPDAIRNGFPGFWKMFPDISYSLKRVVAEGDLVAIHYHWKMKKDDRGNAVVDIWRFENGKAVEHWDVVQAVPDPEKSANKNTMF